MSVDVTIKHPFSMIVVGPSGSGKTVFVDRLLAERRRVICDAPASVIWYYGAYQESFRDLPYEFREGCPPPVPEESDVIIVVDDLMCEAQEEVSKMFTKFCHHQKISCIFLSQNLFLKGSQSRNISINANYIVLMKNTRDKAQISHLGRQIFPSSSKTLTNVYEDATKEPYSYLLLDFTPETDDRVRMRTKIFPGEITTAYVPKGIKSFS
jgi:hypothetical protein